MHPSSVAHILWAKLRLPKSAPKLQCERGWDNCRHMAAPLCTMRIDAQRVSASKWQTCIKITIVRANPWPNLPKNKTDVAIFGNVVVVSGLLTGGAAPGATATLESHIQGVGCA
jgi:hypothetical protein